LCLCCDTRPQTNDRLFLPSHAELLSFFMFLLGKCFCQNVSLCSFNGMDCIDTLPGTSWSLNQRYPIAMCLDRGVSLGGFVVARIYAAQLSSQTVLMLDCSFNSIWSDSANDFKICFTGRRLCIAVDRAIYSASIVESAICDWSLLFQRIGNLNLVVDLTLLGSWASSTRLNTLAKSASM
jgi:hypothetical protein